MKIFCIGLNKTGTISLHRALETLGFRSLHFGGPEVAGLIKQAESEGRRLADLLGDYDAYSDIWRLSERFDVLDRQYPGSKFILTTRDLEGWLDSRRRHVERNIVRKELGRYSGQFLTVDIEDWTRLYHEHHQRVRAYFADRPDDLLVMDITRGDGYELLCPFLGVEIPEEPFPWENRGDDWRPGAKADARGPGAGASTGTASPGTAPTSARSARRPAPVVIARRAVQAAPPPVRRTLRAAARRIRPAVRRTRPLARRARFAVRHPRAAARRAGRRAKRWAARRSSRHPPPGTGRRRPARVVARAAAEHIDVDEVLARLDRLADRPGVTVVVAIHDAYEALRRCLASLERNTDARDTEILLIDDASTDPRVAELLDAWGRRAGVRVLRNDENLGYTRTVNRGIVESSGDVVLLNSDCEVTPRWLQNLVDCAYRDPRIATVTALSDNAGAFSVPDIGVANDRPVHLSGDETGRLVSRTSGRVAPVTPTGNGFCMYIKRSAIDDIGLFDAEAFPRGYGEEGDLCMRARAAGWVNVVDDATIVYHQRSASFGAEKAELERAGRAQLDARHPDYTPLIREFVRSEPLARVQETVRAAYAASTALTERLRPRVLYVHHRGTGGTVETNADLMAALREGYEPYLLTCDTRALELSRVDADGAELIERWTLPDQLRPDQLTDPVYRATVADILVRQQIELVHVRVLLGHTLDLPSVARALDIPVVLSFHDFFLVCPTVHLLDEADRFCGGSCTPGDGECRIPSPWVRGVPPLKHAWVNVWREAVAHMLDACDAFVTTSPTARAIHLRAYPQLADRPFALIEHGRDLPFEPIDPPGDLRGRIRIAIPGALDVHKGARFLERLVACDAAGRLELHFLGKVPEEYRHLGVMHGRYQRSELAQKLRQIGPAFVGIFSVWAETYSHTLSEAWAAGVPVLVTDLGAPRERVERHGGGWILDHTDPAAAYARIIEICDDEPGYRRVRAEVGTRGVRSLEEMAADYDGLYQATRLRRRTIGRAVAGRTAEPANANVTAADARDARPRPLRARLFVVHGTNGNHPPTAHVRMLRRLGHPLVRGELTAGVSTVESFLDRPPDDLDVAIVQRNAVPPELVEPFLEALADREIPLVVDIDDDLFAIDPTDDSYSDYAADLVPLKRLLGAADLVTVSTEHLGQAMRAHARRVAVVPNMLDELLWFGGLPAFPAPFERRRPAVRATAGARRGRWRVRTHRTRCNVVYIGSRTHARDLALLRPVVERLRERRDLDVRLFVVGGEPDRPRSDRWYTRVHIPAGASRYPTFVSWLRSRATEWDVAVAPLLDTPFNRSKSDLKHLEYAALGLPGIYSDVVPYRESVRDGETGLVVPNDEGAWYDAIARLALDDALRAELATAARARVVAERCLRHESVDYVCLLRDL